MVKGTQNRLWPQSVGLQLPLEEATNSQQNRCSFEIAWSQLYQSHNGNLPPFAPRSCKKRNREPADKACAR